MSFGYVLIGSAQSRRCTPDYCTHFSVFGIRGAFCLRRYRQVRGVRHGLPRAYNTWSLGGRPKVADVSSVQNREHDALGVGTIIDISTVSRMVLLSTNQNSKSPGKNFLDRQTGNGRDFLFKRDLEASFSTHRSRTVLTMHSLWVQHSIIPP